MDDFDRDDRHNRGVLPNWLAWLLVLGLIALIGVVLAGAEEPPCAPPGISLLSPGECGYRHMRPL